MKCKTKKMGRQDQNKKKGESGRKTKKNGETRRKRKKMKR